MKRPKNLSNSGHPVNELIPGDGRAWYEREDPARGVTLWLALYHHIDRRGAAELYDLESYADASIMDEDWPEEELEDYRSKHGRYHFLITRLYPDLWRELIFGHLVAYGFSNTAPLDAPRQRIAQERWRELKMNIQESSATGSGLVITQILVFAGDKVARKVEPVPARKYSVTALRDWYIARVKDLTQLGLRSSREKDYADANGVFGGQISRRAVEEIRRRHAPAHWCRQGRPRGNRSSGEPE